MIGGSTASHTTGIHGDIYCSRCSPAGVIGEFYDSFALDVFSAVGKYRLGGYSDSTGPNALYAQVSEQTAVNGFNIVTAGVTEFALTTTINWTAVQAELSSLDVYFNPSDTASYGNHLNRSYAALPSSYSGGTSFAQTFHTKFHHT